jgi:hypothetical protein
VCERSIAIKHSYRLSALNDTKKFAQSSLEFSDANLLHDYI